MTNNSPRRLVSRGAYLCNIGMKFTLNTLATAAITAGIVSVVNFVCWIVIEHVARRDMLQTWLWCNLLSIGITMLFLLGGLMYRKSNQIEAVEILTERNVHLLPQRETLVRVAKESSPEPDLLRVFDKLHGVHSDELVRSINGSKES